MDNKCVCCGADIPEGRQVCPACELREENKSLHLQLETMTQDRNYYRDAYHHLLKERNGGAGE